MKILGRFGAPWETFRGPGGGSGGLMGGLLAPSGRQDGPKVAPRGRQEAPRGRQKTAKRWFLEPKNGPKRLQQAIKRGKIKQIPETSKLMTFSMKMLDL